MAGWLRPPSVVDELWGVHDYTTIAPGALNDRLARIALAPERRESILARTRGIIVTNYAIVRALDRAPRAGAVACAARRRRHRVRPLCARDRLDRSSSSGCATNAACSSCRAIIRDGRLPPHRLRRRSVAAARAASSGSARFSTRFPQAPRRCCADLALVGFGHVGTPFRAAARRMPPSCSTRARSRRAGSSASPRAGTGRIFDRRWHRTPAAARPVDDGGSCVRSAPCRSCHVSGTTPSSPRSHERRTAPRADRNDDARHRDRQPAIDHVRAALAAGCHVVTANKGPVAFAYRELSATAQRGTACRSCSKAR